MHVSLTQSHWEHFSMYPVRARLDRTTKTVQSDLTRPTFAANVDPGNFSGPLRKALPADIPPSPDKWSRPVDQTENRCPLLVRELRPRPDHLVQSVILHRGGGSVGDTLAITARNRLC